MMQYKTVHIYALDFTVIERYLTPETIFKNFMVDLNFDSKHGFVTGQALNCMLRLVTPVFQHKPWNYYKQLYSICMIILHTRCPLLTKTNSLDVYHDLQLL